MIKSLSNSLDPKLVHSAGYHSHVRGISKFGRENMLNLIEGHCQMPESSKRVSWRPPLLSIHTIHRCNIHLYHFQASPTFFVSKSILRGILAYCSGTSETNTPYINLSLKEEPTLWSHSHPSAVHESYRTRTLGDLPSFVTFFNDLHFASHARLHRHYRTSYIDIPALMSADSIFERATSSFLSDYFIKGDALVYFKAIGSQATENVPWW